MAEVYQNPNPLTEEDSQDGGRDSNQRFELQSIDQPSSSSSIPISLVEQQSVVHNIVPIFGSVCDCGYASEMHDTFCVKTELCSPTITNHNPLHYFAVFDGHGGSEVADYCKEMMHMFFEQEFMLDGEENQGLPATRGRWIKLIEKSFLKMDEVALDICTCGSIRKLGGCATHFLRHGHNMVGSTAVVALLTSDQIIVANCGDSRAVLSRGGKPIPLSLDHKPDRPNERARIELAGGRVTHKHGASRVMGILAMTRALGDKYLKPLVISKPEIIFTPRTREDEFLLLASDGLWDALSNNMACEVAYNCLFGEDTDASEGTRDYESRCGNAARLLTNLAMGRKSLDNITVVIINLRRH